MQNRDPLERSWRIRRAIIIGTIVWCVAMVTYLAVWGRDINLSETTVNGCLLLMASVIGSYVFGAVWDDRNRDRARAEVDPPYQREVVRERVVAPAVQRDPATDPPDGYAE